MSETIQIRLTEPEKMHFAGISLARSIYGTVDIFLQGELGAGKTVFLKGFAEGVGINEPITSPTYALEQRYKTAKNGECIHIDLYRLNSNQAEELLVQTDDHEGIRCIEWADRVQRRKSPAIHITIEETEQENVRNLTIEFEDIQLPSPQQIAQWREDVQIPPNVILHCNAVANVCKRIAEHFLQNGIICRPEALYCAGQLHDLLRFIDFHPGSDHLNPEVSDEQRSVWETWRQKFPDMGHEAAIAEFLIQQKFPELAEIIRPHGLRIDKDERNTLEQKILFYADKRVMMDTVVSIDKRFEDFKNRYCDGKENPRQKEWYNECKRLEKELFPEGPPLVS